MLSLVNGLDAAGRRDSTGFTLRLRERLAIIGSIEQWRIPHDPPPYFWGVCENAILER
jgi:hypothetical protein